LSAGNEREYIDFLQNKERKGGKMVDTQQEPNRILTNFANRLDDLMVEDLLGQVTPEQINEYYGWVNDCQIAEMLRKLQEHDSILPLK